MDHRTVEAEKSRDLLSASCRPRKVGQSSSLSRKARGLGRAANGVKSQSESESEGLRARSAGVWGQEMRDVPAQRANHPSSTFLSYLGPFALVGVIFTQSANLNAKFPPETPFQTPPDIRFYQFPGCPQPSDVDT